MINPKRLCLISKPSYKHRFVLGFLRALRTIHKQKPSSSSPRQICERYVKVKKAADSSMASAIGSTRAWSRALLRRIRGQSQKKSKPNTSKFSKAKEINSVLLRLEENIYSCKENELRKLVPGGEAMDMCNLLDETAHYIKCLNTQVKLMRGIADFYSAV